jgi:hypothetical protein
MVIHTGTLNEAVRTGCHVPLAEPRLAEDPTHAALRSWWRARPAGLRRAVIAAAVTVLLPALLALTGFLLLLREDAGALPRTVPVAGHDGLWLGHAWVDGRRTAGDVQALAARLRGTGIRDVFVHVGPLSNDGSLNPALRPRARWLVTGLHRLVPGLRVQAWLGDLVGHGRLDLADAQTRARVLVSDAQVLAQGFDGIHYDLEPIPSGDRGYLRLLAATHALTRAHGAVLSAACPQAEPLPQLERLFLGLPHWWSAGYLHAVAVRADEVALMTYGTGAPTRAAYSGYLRRQAGLALAAVPPRVTLLMGLPAYHTREFGHTSAETVAAAIRGIRLALGPHPGRSLVGVALYVDFAATPADWASYQADWAAPGR